MQKKIITNVLLGGSVGVILAVPLVVLAQAPEGAPMTIEAIYNAICTIANWFFAFMLAGAIIAFIYAGYLFFSSAGGPKVDQAKKTLMYAIIGTAIAVLSRALISIIGNLLGVSDLTSFTCPG